MARHVLLIFFFFIIQADSLSSLESLLFAYASHSILILSSSILSIARASPFRPQKILPWNTVQGAPSFSVKVHDHEWMFNNIAWTTKKTERQKENKRVGDSVEEENQEIVRETHSFGVSETKPNCPFFFWLQHRLPREIQSKTLSTFFLLFFETSTYIFRWNGSKKSNNWYKKKLDEFQRTAEERKIEIRGTTPFQR